MAGKVVTILFLARDEGFDRHSAGPKLHYRQPAGVGRFPCEMPLAFLTPIVFVGCLDHT